jgi:DNA-binding NtrC family response regulator
MKKARKAPTGELRSEYTRSDFGALVRGKYVEQLRERSNVVVLDPEITDLFPNGASVNAALRALAEIAKRAQSSPRLQAPSLHIASPASDPLPADLPAESKEANFTMSLEEIERKLLSKALAKAAGNQTRAAVILGITRDTLRYKMKKFSVH